MLTDDQRRRVLENRQRALLKLQTLTTSKKVTSESSQRSGSIENASTDIVAASEEPNGSSSHSKTAASSTATCFASTTLSDDAMCLKALEESELALSESTTTPSRGHFPTLGSNLDVFTSEWTSSQEEELSRAVEVAEEQAAAVAHPPHPVCPYCRTPLQTVGQLYECRNEASQGACCYSQRWPWPHFVDLELVTTGSPHCTDAPSTDDRNGGHASFRVTLTKVSAMSNGANAGIVLASVCRGLASSLAAARFFIPEALHAVPTLDAPASSFVLPLEAYETTLKHLHACVDKAGVMVRPIPRGYLSLARALHRKPSLPLLQQQPAHKDIQGAHRHHHVPERPRERLSLVDDAAVMELMRRVPPRLMATLYPYQRAGLVYALRRSCRILLADEMGCGKTLQAVALIATALGRGPVLVLCPAVVRPMWTFELDKWLDTSCGSSSGVAAVRGIEGQFDAWHDPADRWSRGSFSSVTVTSYAMLRHLPEMASWKWALVVRCRSTSFWGAVLLLCLLLLYSACMSPVVLFACAKVLDEAHEPLRTPSTAPLRPHTLPHLLRDLILGADAAAVRGGPPHLLSTLVLLYVLVSTSSSLFVF